VTFQSLGICLLVWVALLELGHRVGIGGPVKLHWQRRLALNGFLLAAITLLTGFIWALCLNHSLSKYQERQKLVHLEADLAATAYRRTSLLPVLDQRLFRAQLSAFLEVELAEFQPHDNLFSDPSEQRIHPICDALIKHCAKMELPDAHEIRRDSMFVQLSSMISSHYRLRYSLQERLPKTVWYSLLALSSLCCFVTGACFGTFYSDSGQSHASETIHALPSQRRSWQIWIASLAIWCGLTALLINLDDPYSGILKISLENIQELKIACQRDLV
jgi:hypothetical protein